MKNIFLSLLSVCAMIVFGVSCPIHYFWGNPNPGPPSPWDEEDRLSSWDHINQLVIKPDNWQMIAGNRDLFQLGSSEFYHTYNSSFFDESVLFLGIFTVYNRSYGTFPAIDGSTVLLPLAAEFGWQFLDLNSDNTRSFFGFSTTHQAYRKLIGADRDNRTEGSLIYFRSRAGNTVYFDQYYFSQQPDIILATSPSAAELDLARNKGVALTIEPVCYDSFVFITHVDNPVDDLTAEQIRRIYSGQITSWSEVGGDDEEIIAFQRNPGSGSQTAMEEMVMNGIRMMDAPAGWYHAGMGILIDFIAEYQNRPTSIGYSFKYYIDRLYKNPGIKILKVNGIEPNDDNVRNSTYPFTAPYNGVIRSSDANGTGGRALDWLLSEEGQRVIAQAGYVPLREIY